MIVAVSILSAIHCVVFLFAAFHWRRIREVKTQIITGPKFTILIPVRNESTHITDILGDISDQSYPKDHFQVIVIDDHSEDDTIEKTARFKAEFELTILTLPEGKTGKKKALTMGVEHARNPIIITTDGDCRIPPEWLASYASFYSSGNPKMVAGPVRMKGERLIEKLQVLEFSTLIGFGAAALKSGNPSMCNGANLSYHKEVFLEVNGYAGNENIPSGDDEFLLQKVFARYPGEVGFLKDSGAIVTTQAKPTVSEFINQRIRWTGKWKYHKSWFVKVLAVVVFLDYFTLLAGAVMLLAGSIPVIPFLSVLVARYLSEVLLAWPVSGFLRVRSFILPSLIIQIIYPVCVSFLGFASIFGHYSWKGRKY